jgi:hypothetical protein
MAEREGFEPPIPLQVCLISSQVHSTGLCHLSVLLGDLFCCSYRSTPFCRLAAFCAGVRFGVPFAFTVHQAVCGRSLMLGSEMGVAHDHLKRSVPEKLCDSAQIYPGHHESTGKSMAVAMKDISLSSHHEQAYSSRRLDEINGPLLAGGFPLLFSPPFFLSGGNSRVCSCAQWLALAIWFGQVCPILERCSTTVLTAPSTASNSPLTC